MQVYPAEHADAVAVIKADVIIIYPAGDVAQLYRAGRVLYRGLCAHELKKAGEARRTLHVDLRELRKLLHRRDEGRHVQREGDKVDIAHFAAAHYQQPADRHDSDLRDAGGELHPAHEKAHGPVILHLGAAEHAVGRVELGAFLLLVGEGLGRAYAGDAAFNGGVYLRRLALDLDVGLFHAHALRQREPQAHRDYHRQHQRKAPFQRIHYAKRANYRQRADEYVLRPVMGKLRHFKKVAGDAAHQDAGAVLVVKAA